MCYNHHMLGKFITKNWYAIAIISLVINVANTLITWYLGHWFAPIGAFISGLLLASIIDYRSLRGMQNILHKSMALNESMWNELRTICKLAGVDQKLNVPKEFFNGSEKN